MTCYVNAKVLNVKGYVWVIKGCCPLLQRSLEKSHLTHYYNSVAEDLFSGKIMRLKTRQSSAGPIWSQRNSSKCSVARLCLQSQDLKPTKIFENIWWGERKTSQDSLRDAVEVRALWKCEEEFIETNLWMRTLIQTDLIVFREKVQRPESWTELS